MEIEVVALPGSYNAETFLHTKTCTVHDSDFYTKSTSNDTAKQMDCDAFVAGSQALAGGEYHIKHIL